jgi:beta-phosphoglucomutase family hydrolase
MEREMKLDIDPKAEGLIFDMDGTLADSMPIHFEAWKITAKENGFEYTEDQFYELAGMPTWRIVPVINERLGLNIDPEKFSRRKEQVFLDLLTDVKPVEPVVELVYKYHNKLPMSIGTGGKKEIALLTIKMMGLDKYIDILVAADDVKNHKPAPDTFLKCAELMGIEPSLCQVFEDGEMGLKAAEAAGMIATDIRPFI